MLFNGRALIFTFSGTQVRIAEHEHLQSLFKMSMGGTYQAGKRDILDREEAGAEGRTRPGRGTY